MRYTLALIIGAWTAGTAAAAQEAVPAHFPPVAQILGADMIPAPGAAKGAAVGFEALVGQLSAPTLSARRTAVAALGVPDNLRAVPYLGAVLLRLDESNELRVAAAMALGRIRNWRALTYLRQALRDSSKELRFAAALALGKSKTPDSVALLGETLRKDPDWWVRFAAAVALGEYRDPAAVHALGLAAREEKEWQVRMQSVRSLGQIGSRDAAYALNDPLKDSDAGVRAAAAMALGDIGGLDAINLLATALREERDEFPRRAMADALKSLLSRP